MTLYESAGETFDAEFPGVLGDDSWDCYIDGVKADDSYVIKQNDQIRLIIQDWGFIQSQSIPIPIQSNPNRIPIQSNPNRIPIQSNPSLS